MPQLLTVAVTRPGARPVRAWVPLLPVALVLSPAVALAVVVTAVACLACRVSLAAALVAGWRVACALPGTRVDIEQGRTAVLVAIR